MPRVSRTLLLLLLPLGNATVAAQVSPRPDSTRVYELEDLTVTVTRTKEPLARVPMAVGVVDKASLQRGRAGLGLDEALTDLPGVYLANRYNYSLDQRLSIRGAGSRANFGSRGVKILIDGIPQTLPDGQSQLTDLDLSTIGRVEVLRGASSALYGNAAGGAISFTSLPTAPDPLGATLRYESGSFGLRKGMIRLSGRDGPLSAAVSFSHTDWEGFRQQSSFEGNTFGAVVDWIASESTILTARYAVGDQPRAENPGALNASELAADRDSAPANNIVRDAMKDVLQRRLSVTLKRFGEGGTEFSATVFYLTRSLDNPLSTGLWNLLDRRAGGLRTQLTRPLGTREGAPKLIVGMDLQAFRDERTNLTPVPAEGPVTDTTLRQRETVSEFGPFVQLSWDRTPKLHLNGGVRYDAVTFHVTDQLLSDGNSSGQRTMSSLSGGAGASYALNDRFVPYANLSTSFETPTTTELAVNETGVGGFNDSLAPQRSLSFEVGARGSVGVATSWTAAWFVIATRDALVPFAEAGGRSFFRNAGTTRNRGYELGLDWRPSPRVALHGAFTHADYRFTDYVAITNSGADTTSFTGRRLPGVPTEFVRLGVRTSLPNGLWLDVDQTLSSEQYADDANTVRVDGWGAGITNLRWGWTGNVAGLHAAPFAAVNNLWGREYIGSVTVNGFGGRVFEPSPGRNYYVGMELGWAKR